MRLRLIQVGEAVQNSLDSLDQTINSYGEPTPLPDPKHYMHDKQPPKLEPVGTDENSALATEARSGIDAAFNNPLFEDAA